MATDATGGREGFLALGGANRIVRQTGERADIIRHILDGFRTELRMRWHDAHAANVQGFLDLLRLNLERRNEG